MKRFVHWNRFLGLGAASLLVLASIRVSPIWAAEPEPLTGQFQVNTTTTNTQTSPDVALSPDGGFVVVWESDSSTGDDSSVRSVQAQPFDASALPSGLEQQVNTYTSSYQGDARVAVAPSGVATVVWSSFMTSPGDDLADLSVQARQLGSDGTPLGEQFQVNSGTPNDQNDPAVVARADSSLVVVWESLGISSGSDAFGESVQLQRLLADGSADGSETQVNTTIVMDQENPRAASAADGSFVVVWQSDFSGIGGDISGTSVQGQRFLADGTPDGSEFQVNTDTTGNQVNPAVAMAPDGDFVVVWEDYVSPGLPDSTRISGQRFLADGSPAGAQFQVNTYTTGLQEDPVVAMNADGRFVVAWESLDGDGEGISAQSFLSDGSPQGEEFLVNSLTTDDQEDPSVSMADDGRFVVAWASYTSGGDDSSDRSIQARLFVAALFADGFESGDASAWSRSVP